MRHLSCHTTPCRFCCRAFQFGGTLLQFHDELVVLLHQRADFIIVFPFDRLILFVNFDVAQLVLDQGQGAGQTACDEQDENQGTAKQHDDDIEIGKDVVADLVVQVGGTRKIRCVEIGQGVAVGIGQRDISRLIPTLAKVLLVGKEEVLVAVQTMIGLSIHHRSLQVELKDFGTGGGQQLSVELIEIQIGKEGVGIVLQDIGPFVLRGRAHQGGQVKIVAHFKRKRSGGLKLGIGGVLVVERAHIKHRDRTYGQERNAKR